MKTDIGSQVCKWGGSSLADGNRAKNVVNFILKNKIDVVVFSAPGKSHSLDKKITDILVEITKTQDPKHLYLEIKNRFCEIASALNVKINIDKIISDIKTYYEKTKDNSFLLSRGEWLMSKIMSKALGYFFADTKNIIKFDKLGRLKDVTYTNIQNLVKQHKQVVFPGFYGSFNKKIKVFSRGGSDITGAIISKALNKNYTNFTDVDGVYNTYPLNVTSKKIKTISYNDMKFLGLFGFSVLHHKCSDILEGTNIVTTIKSSFEPLKAGTMVKGNYSQVFARSKTNALLVQSNNDIFSLLIKYKIYILFSYKYLNNYFYLVDKKEKQFLIDNKITVFDVLVTAYVNPKSTKGKIFVSNNHYIKIEKIN